MNETEQRFCTSCGSPLRAGTAFCTSCGAALSSAAASEDAGPATQQVPSVDADPPTRVAPAAPVATPSPTAPPAAAPGEPIETTGAPLTAPRTPDPPVSSAPNNRKPVLIGAAIAAAVIVIGVAAFLLFGSGGDDEVSADGDNGGAAETIDAPTTARPTLPREESTLPRRSTTTTRLPTTSYAGPPVELTPYGATASATDANGTDECTPPNNTSFPVSNLFDGDTSTAWRVNGNGTGTTITVDFGETVSLSTVGLIPGYAKRDPCSGVDRFPQGYRIASVTYTFDDGSVEQQSFSDSPTLQTIPVDVDTRRVLVTIGGVREPRFPVGSEERREKTAISEMAFTGTVR